MPTTHPDRRPNTLASVVVAALLVALAMALVAPPAGSTATTPPFKALAMVPPVDEMALLQEAVDAAFEATVPAEEPAKPISAPAEPAVVLDWVVEEAPGLGETIGRIRIPKAGVDWPLIEGVQKEQLDISPGHMPRTAMPGQFGNAVIAGHRSTFGAPFSNLDLLEPGDEIQVDTGIGTHTYAVVSTEIVLPTGMWTVQHRDGGWLTLVTCHPKGSNAQRMIVFARLVDGPNLAAVEAAFTGEYLPPKDPTTEAPEESPHDPGDSIEVSGPYPAVFEIRWL
jgi:LPXTG-site transpeptidase (sortase) family protein